MNEEQTQAQVKDAVIGLPKSWRDRDIEGFKRFTHYNMYGYYLGSGLLGEGADSEKVYEEVSKWWAAGLRSTMTPSHVAVRLVGSDAAIATCYLQGTETWDGVNSIEGTWRATVVLSKANGQWKWLHYHYSPLTTSQTERRA